MIYVFVALGMFLAFGALCTAIDRHEPISLVYVLSLAVSCFGAAIALLAATS